ncbi:MAG: 50S ribosomal protein L13 [Elusimicrobia bacterium]|nr:50S ribosomal protein L13 [Elusimicrobiota bacterium]
MSQKTTLIDPKTAQSQRRWVLIDAKGAVLGRLATKAAVLLRGKHKAYFSPSVDCGDFVVVTNAKDVRITGEKADSKFYFRHSGYAGGAKTVSYKLQMERDPRRVIELAVKRMLPDNALRRHQLRRLKVYPGAAHPHAAQKVEAVRV